MLLSLPQEDQPNTVEILNNGVVEYSMVGKINVSLTERFLLRTHSGSPAVSNLTDF